MRTVSEAFMNVTQRMQIAKVVITVAGDKYIRSDRLPPMPPKSYHNLIFHWITKMMHDPVSVAKIMFPCHYISQTISHIVESASKPVDFYIIAFSDDNDEDIT